MAGFQLITDSTCDLEQKILDENKIDYAPMNYTIGSEEFPAMLDWSSHPAEDLYEAMRCGTIVKTTQVPAAAYEEHFKKALDAGLDILYISCSSALSGSINIARMVKRELESQYPDREILLVDALISSLGQGHLCLEAAKMRDQGRSAKETADYIESIKLTIHQYGTVADLEYLKRAGRVTASSAFFGNFLGIKPIIISDKIGQNYAIKKVKGSANVRKEIVAMVKDEVRNPENQTLYISHADCEEDAKVFRDEILKEVPFKDSYMNYIAPIVGASVGPGTVIVFCIGDEITIQGGE